jgi:hypothetical protein
MLTFTMDRLLTLQLVDSTAIVSWLFSETCVAQFTTCASLSVFLCALSLTAACRHWVWEILLNVISKHIARSDTVRADLRKAEDEERSKPSDMETDTAAAAGTSLSLSW